MTLTRRNALWLMAVVLPVRPAAASDFPYSQTHSFTASRNGRPIGTHRLTFAGDDNRRVVTTTIDFAVQVAGITAYRYSHRGEEIWSTGRLLSLASKTDDNGKQHVVLATRTGDGLLVEREATEPMLPMGVLEQSGLQRSAKGKETMPGDIVPTSHWNIRQVKQSELLNSQLGTKSKVSITAVGREPVRTGTQTVEATRYRYGGDVMLEQWFDDKGRWVKMTFPASDGSTIEYTLQE